MKLSVVIPVWNDPKGLRRLLDQIADMGVFSQVVVIDDASTVSCSPKALGIDPDRYPLAFKYQRLKQNRGAGHARNLGLKLATGSHVIFFDSDDLFTAEFSQLAASLTGREFDFCVFKHVDSRVRENGSYGPLALDEQRWQDSGATGALGVLSPKQAVQLCAIAAYPWNKIYRKTFLQEQKISCTEIRIHNDVEIHWMGFLRAQNILYSDLVCCEHFVAEGMARLTNRTGRERFDVLQALANVQDEFSRAPQALPFLPNFVSFYIGLFGWITEQLEPDLHAPFRHAVQAHLHSHLSLPLYTLATTGNPELGARINRIMKGQPI